MTKPSAAFLCLLNRTVFLGANFYSTKVSRSELPLCVPVSPRESKINPSRRASQRSASGSDGKYVWTAQKSTIKRRRHAPSPTLPGRERAVISLVKGS